MNSASSDFVKHLGRLRERLEHPTDYELAVTYFLEEFAGDMEFIKLSEAEEAPVLGSILGRIIAQMLPGKPRLDQPAMFHLKGHAFIHGNAVVEQHALVFLYFPEINTGVAALIPGTRGAMEVARFKTPGGLPRPELN